jgi:hypothetical protein
MRERARTAAFCLNVGMSKMGASLVIVLLALAAPAGAADSASWLVVENLDTQTCYRMTDMPAGANWRRLGQFNTFREAGTWIWEHRGSLCPKSPVFG